MAFRKACSLDEVWEGDMTEVEVDEHVVLLIGLEGGEVRAYQGACPHQDIPLSEGRFDGRVLTCRAHQWTFDASTGQGINPGDCCLAQYPVRVEGDDVLVDVEGVQPLFAHS
ncbi:MAG: 2Fe-2S ferredoxin [Burkholderiales bacterium 66-5]|uniref:Rieske 2Fe-2S domain-containing protein n=1 Tax=Comamonas badia TaxID=265291 RepID=UPI00041354EB|nr:Rieske 2Fe-2S domain-containing protein [Comamonas badia]OJU88350.1 MAG: 2Fe-2S ferredoxin [Burkholderiales bacterium 66-5]